MQATGNKEIGKAKQTTKPKPKDGTPRLSHYGGKPLPEKVRKVIEAIQKEMVDGHRKNDKRPKSLPNMPSELIYSQVKKEKEKMIEFCDSDLDTNQCLCYNIFVPFRVTKKLQPNSDNSTETWIWAENVISFKKISEEQTYDKLLVIEVERYREPNAKGKRKVVFPAIPPNADKLPMKIKLFHKVNVGKHSGHCLISSHQMTISWLRSRLHKAIQAYLKSKKPEVELNPVIRQKKEGPLYLHLSYGNAEKKQRHVLFAVYPAFRVATSCHMIIPMVPHFDKIPENLAGSPAKEFLWKRIAKCYVNQPEHKHKIIKFGKIELAKERALNESVQKSNVASKERAACKDVKRELSQSQKEYCKECVNPASRMLLEYYYQYGDIPKEEMTQAGSFVQEILEFIKHSIKKDRKSNDPKIVEFVKSGSVPEKLKVVQADEFDVMVKIRLPESKIDYSFYSDDAFPPGFTICRVKATGNLSLSLKRCLVKVDAFDTERCLDPEKLAFGWLYGMLERAIYKYKGASNSPKADLKLKRGGPALMLQIIPHASTSDDKQPLPEEIKVDLVLALERSSDDSRLFVPKRARLQSFYKMNLKRSKMESGSPADGNAKPTGIGEEMKSCEEESDERKKSGGLKSCVEMKFDEENKCGEEKKSDEEKKSGEEIKSLEERTKDAKENHGYMWRISFSVEEKKFLNHVDEQQQKSGVQGCQKICLKILKTICTREALKCKESVICHKLSSYILKTALFHMLSQSDLCKDWKIDCLAERYVEFLQKVSKLGDKLLHFFIGNGIYLKHIFPDERDICKENASIDLFDDLHATLKRQLHKRFSCIRKSFIDCKEEMDKEFQNTQDSSDEEVKDDDQVYLTFLKKVIGEKTPEEIIHPNVVAYVKSKEDEETEKKLNEKQRVDKQINEAVKNERRSESRLPLDQNMKIVQENQEKNEGRRKRKIVEDYNDWQLRFLMDSLDDDDDNDGGYNVVDDYDEDDSDDDDEDDIDYVDCDYVDNVDCD